GGGSRFPTTLGLFGGNAVPPTFVQYVHNSNLTELMSAADTALPNNLTAVYEPDNPERGDRHFNETNMTVRPFANGDTYYLGVGGGGGYGDAIERDPAAVIRDLRRGLVTHWAARNIYHVAYDEDSLRLDADATVALRLQVREDRKKRGKRYDEFIEEWRKLAPPAELLTYYGSYPDPEVGLTDHAG
ncbi:MAG: acetone carboxylase subunit alpha, partial [Gammaproteobacteria bacterium]